MVNHLQHRQPEFSTVMYIKYKNAVYVNECNLIRYMYTPHVEISLDLVNDR